MTERTRDIEIGIRDLRAREGSHIAYLWEKREKFREAVQFLHRGIHSGDHLVVFGHGEANDRVLEVLASMGHDPDRLQAAGQLSVLGPGSSGDHTLERIGETFQAALDAGASMIRLLGNIGWGRSDWPEERDILRFEAKVTGAAARFPCIVVCMYDIKSLTGNIILKGAFCTHPLTIYNNLVRNNPMCIEVEAFLAQLDAEEDLTDNDAA
jgi:hypothetical protein